MIIVIPCYIIIGLVFLAIVVKHDGRPARIRDIIEIGLFWPIMLLVVWWTWNEDD